MNWYLLAYDIRDPRRLKRMHRCLARRGVALQRSVFLVEGGAERIASLLADARGIMDEREDDLRLFPIHHPSRLWLHGTATPLAETGEKPLVARLVERLRLFRGGARNE